MPKMTEKEFESAVAARVGEQVDARFDISRIAREVAKEAGLEFAPEPVATLDSLEVSDLGGEHAYLGIPRGFPSKEVKLATLTAAAARYNAYPGLREKAESLCSLIRSNFAPGSQRYVEAEIHALEVELAKGPK